jgi:hypothetical protein
MTQTAAAAATTNTAITRTRTGTGTRSGRGRWWGRRPWLGMFVGGLGLWVAAVVVVVVVTFVTQNLNLVPTIILLGSFLVPVSFVAYAFGRAGQVVTAQRILPGFGSGGVGGVWGASLLEAEWTSPREVDTGVMRPWSMVAG